MKRKHLALLWVCVISVGLGANAQDEAAGAISPHPTERFTNLEERAYHPRWSPDGTWIAYTRNAGTQSSLWLQPVQGGDSVHVPVEKNGDLSFCWSPDGAHIVFDAYVNDLQPPFDLYIHTLESSQTRELLAIPGNQIHPSWSPDGEQVCYSQRELYLMPISGGQAERLTPRGEEAWHPTWSPDGTQIAYTSNRTGNEELYVITLADGHIQQLTDSPGYDDRACWSPDGSHIIFVSDRAGQGNDDLWLLSLDDGMFSQLTHGPGNETHPAWSPDGARIAFTVFEWPAADIWILALPEGIP